MHNMKNIKSTLGLFVYIPLGVNVSSRAYQYVSVVSICLSVRICSFYLLISTYLQFLFAYQYVSAVSICLSVRICSFYLLISIVYLILFTIYVRSYANIIYSI